ncbi:MBL fold metallo-hydrolase [Viridibacillus sp. YIM B01967]|uniref:MBL fold metallo-hydrolase n=1 Tax=Viridibacillus soli TaxID=2798301 RepID=A0ABS1H6R8_9BACL|nr:MBL fold metallo-hydrolase [Viridibacillus soli]MBK3495113.1 MBL fold metallo-hydrolase [Viridibacillus soli]
MKINFYHVGVATCLLEIDGKIKIATDPALSPKGTILKFKSFETERLQDPKYDNDIFQNVDLWLITHLHEDHLDLLGKDVIADSALVLTNSDALSFLEGKNVVPLKWTEEYVTKFENYTIKITTIPAYHGNNFITRKIVGKVNGYILEIFDGNDKTTIYLTSDTVYHKDVINSISKELDIIIANLGEVSADKFGGPLTMSIEMLNQFVKELKPTKVIPVHIDDFSHYMTTEDNVLKAGFSILEKGKWIEISDN